MHRHGDHGNPLLRDNLLQFCLLIILRIPFGSDFTTRFYIIFFIISVYKVGSCQLTFQVILHPINSPLMKRRQNWRRLSRRSGLPCSRKVAKLGPNKDERDTPVYFPFDSIIVGADASTRRSWCAVLISQVHCRQKTRSNILLLSRL